MTMARPNMSQTWFQSISWHKPIFATCVAICTKPWRCPNVDAVIWEWLVHDLTISKLLAIPALTNQAGGCRLAQMHPVWSSAERHFISGSWISNLDGVLIEEWSDNSQAVSAISALAHLKLGTGSLYRCTLHSESARLVLLQKEVSEMAPGMSCSFLTVCLSVEECHPSCTFEDTARSFWSSKPGARLKLIWFP